MKQLPLRPRHDLAGATFVAQAGWEVPSSYTNLDEEVGAVRTSAGLIDLSDRVKVRVTGTDRVSFLNGLVTQDIATLAAGKWAYGLVLTPKAKVVGDVWVYAMDDAFLLDMPADEATWVLEHIRKHLISDDVLLEEFPAAHLGLHGPQASAFARRLVGDVAVPNGPDDFITVPLSKKNSMVVGSSAFPHLPGFELISWTSALEDVWHGLVEIGATPIGREAWTTLRIESGRPKAGVDMDESTIALEARLERAISFTKGCYEGQETIARATYQGHMNRLLVGFRIEGDLTPIRGDSVAVDGKPVGGITSGTYSPTVRNVIAMGYIRRPHDALGTRVTIQSEGWQLRGVVTQLPFVSVG